MWLSSGIILVILLSTATAAPAPFAEEDGSLRLPKSSVPTHYDISLTTDVHVGQRAFTGVVKIDIEIKENTDFITLHNRGLQINEVKLINRAEAELEIRFTEDAEKEFLIIESLIRPLEVGELFTIEISYQGSLQLGTSGFYRSSYKVDGETRYLAATQFESTNARYAFPCYDEPEYKAIFDLKITHDASYSAIANIEGTSSPNIDGTTTTSFYPTPKMSSYLLAFLVSDFDFISNEPGSPTLHRIFARSKDVARTAYALQHTEVFLKELECYAIYDYEITKLDSAAIPDFGAGAMENWGLITYKEQYLIGDENSHPRDVLEILKTIAHELGHQFFGNLVTCQWWDQIWLNEGFATFFEYTLVEKIYPQHRMRDYFNIQKLQNALKVDALDSTRAMWSNAETPSGISNLFDRIAYDKSGSVIRMFQNALGEENFRLGLSLYLEMNNHNPVTSDKLYEAFEIIIGQRASNLMFSWTDAFRNWETQKGFPLVHVRADDETGEITVTQQRYYAENEIRDGNEESSWYIPLNMATASNPNFEDTQFTHYFVNGEPNKIIEYPDNFDSSQWFVFNKQQMGFYRVNYDNSNWQALIKVLNSRNFNQIHVLNRAQLIDDSLNLAADGYLNYQTAFGILSYLSRETDYIPWRAAVLNLDKIDYILGDTLAHENFKKFLKNSLKRIYKAHGLEEKPQDSLIDKFGRELAIDWMCRLGDEGCLQHTFEMLKQSLNDDTDIPDSLELTVYCNGLKGFNRQEEFAKLWRRFQSSDDQAERLRIIDGLICSSDPQTINDLLETILVSSNDEIFYRTHERQRILNNVLTRSSAGVTVILNIIDKYYEEIVSMYSASTVDSLLTAASKRLIAFEDQLKLEEILDKHAGHLAEGTRETAMKNVDYNKEWRAGNTFQIINEFLYFEAQALEEEKNQLILPKTSAPTHYKIHLDARNIHTGNRAFTGHVEIDVLIKENTEYILLHSKTQVIDELRVTTKDGVEVPVLEHELYPAADTLIIYFFDELQAASEVVVHVKYSTQLPTFGSGFYQTTYSMNNQVRYLGVTQFQPSGARYTFPHYDEPEYKAVFELSITHHPTYTAIANTFGNATLNDDETVTTVFEPTPLMSSYLLAFVVSDFDYMSNIDDKLPEDTLHRVWVRPDSVSKAWYAVENSAKVLKSLEEYVGFKFELSKVDSAAIPNKGGAMENWGMVTYWETAMIYEEDYNDISHSLKLSGVDVISHELAHQFFGDSVTCQWWDVIWLNEGFATLFEFHITGLLYPEWRTRDFFNLRKLQNAFRYDSREATRPMTSDVTTLSEISNAFDTIAYDKSGSVLRMFQYAVGEEIFRAALQLYLETNDHKPVRPHHLIDAFKTTMAAAGLDTFDFETAFQSWELQKGYPMIHVSLTSSGQFNITQQRFYTLKSEITDTTSSWFIPLTFATESNPNFEDTRPTNFFVNTDSTALITPPAGFDASQWFVFNKQQLGYYRVNYDFANWHALILALNSDDYDKIHVLNRVQLIDDSLTFAAGGYLDYNTAFGILTYLSRETEYTAWFAADLFITQLYTAFGPLNDDLNEFVHHLTEKFYDTFKVPEDETIPFEEVYERYSRELAFKLACNSGNDQCLYDTFIQNHHLAHHGISVPKGLENVIFCSGFRGENKQTEWIALWHLMQNTSDATYKTQLINGLGCSDDPVVQKDFLESLLGAGNSVSYTQAQRRSVFTAVLNSHSGLHAVISFMKDFELEIPRNLGYTLEDVLTLIARTVKTRSQQNVFTDYLLSLNTLDTEAFRRLSTLAGNNLLAQQEPRNSELMSIIQKILEGWRQETTTVTPPTPTPTAPSDTPSPTNPPPTPPTPTPAPTPIPTTPAPVTESTTLGAASIGLKLVTLFGSLFVAFSLKM